MSISRRRFVKAGIAAASIGAAKLEASPMNQPIGFQNFEVFPDLARDWQGTWNTMAGIGYKFCDLVKGGPVAQRTAAELKASLTQAGLAVRGSSSCCLNDSGAAGCGGYLEGISQR